MCLDTTLRRTNPLSPFPGIRLPVVTAREIILVAASLATIVQNTSERMHLRKVRLLSTPLYTRAHDEQTGYQDHTVVEAMYSSADITLHHTLLYFIASWYVG